VSIKAVHFDDVPPYYTISLGGGGAERSTVRSKLTVRPENIAAAPARDDTRLHKPANCSILKQLMTIGLALLAIGFATMAHVSKVRAVFVKHSLLPPGVRAPPPLPLPPRRPPPLIHDDDDEILCDCAWVAVPGQSCRETNGNAGFPCWAHCCK